MRLEEEYRKLTMLSKSRSLSASTCLPDRVGQPDRGQIERARSGWMRVLYWTEFDQSRYYGAQDCDPLQYRRS
ncbi:MAG: hypothetical protein R3C56_10700 [Pirellulaceae bacterium]